MEQTQEYTRQSTWRDPRTGRNTELIAAAGPVVLWRVTDPLRHPDTTNSERYIMLCGQQRCAFAMLPNNPKMFTASWDHHMHLAVDGGVMRCWTIGASNLSSLWYEFGPLAQSLLLSLGLRPQIEYDVEGNEFYRRRPDDPLAPPTVIFP